MGGLTKSLKKGLYHVNSNWKAGLGIAHGHQMRNGADLGMKLWDLKSFQLFI